jgi:hypothetical protein
MPDSIVFICGALAALFCVVLAMRFAGFAGQKPQDYALGGPAFDLRKHLNGALVCEGVLYGPMGRVSSRFVADMLGSWDGNKGHLVENFKYDSGTAQRREWFLTTGNDGKIKAEAADVIGIGQGEQMGSAMRLNYRIQLAQGAGGHVLDVTDWMYLLENGTLVNRSQMRKFGIKVAELVATIRRADA